ncbi:MAG: acetyltransferase [Rhodospirillaceae bacterium]
MTIPVSLYIAGAGGLGREIALYATEMIAAGQLPARLAGFLDDTGADPAAFGCALPVVSTIDGWRPQKTDRVVIAVGDPGARRQIAERLVRIGAGFATLIHPTAWVAGNARLEPGSIVAPLAAIGPHAVIGAHCLINVHAGIGHDVELGAYNVLAPGAVLNGFVRSGAGVLVGSSVVVTARLTLGEGCRIAAGAVVYADIPPGTTAHGNPARAMKLPG